MSDVPQQEVPDDGGLSEILSRRYAHERQAAQVDADDTVGTMSWLIGRKGGQRGKRLHNNDGWRTPPPAA
jgi:hypothetical protein